MSSQATLSPTDEVSPFQAAWPAARLVEYFPAPASALMLSGASAPLVMMLMTPPIASDPYNADLGPLTISILSTRSGDMFWIAAAPLVPELILTPSIRTSV